MTKPIKPLIPNRIFPKFTLSNKIVGFFVASIIITGFLQALGIIDLRSMFFPSTEQSGVKILTDVWSGTYSYAQNFDNQGPVFYYTDRFILSFSRIGDNIAGSYTQYSGEQGTTENIIGTIIGTQIKFNDDWCPATNVQSSTCFRFAGTISGNSLNLISERCSFNAFCPSRYSTSSQSPAIKGTVTLIKT